MESFKFVASTGQPYDIRLPDPGPVQKSVFVFSFHKSGSTLLHDMLGSYCREIGVPTFSLFDEAFRQGVSTDQIQADAAECFRKTGYIYTGFRHFPLFNIDLKDVPAILLARDPRDMLVSLYYSVRRSHVIPPGNETLKKSRLEAASIDINEFAFKRKGMYIRAFQHYCEALADSDLTIYRYEDVIYQKDEWLADLVEKLGLRVVPRLVSLVARQSDVFPQNEDDRRHIRQVHPGNYKQKLSAETIRALDQALAEFLTYFDYETLDAER